MMKFGGKSKRPKETTPHLQDLWKILNKNLLSRLLLQGSMFPFINSLPWHTTFHYDRSLIFYSIVFSLPWQKGNIEPAFSPIPNKHKSTLFNKKKDCI